MEKTKQEGAGIINLKYDKDALLALIEEQAMEKENAVEKSEYDNRMIYSWKCQEEGGCFTFLDDSNIVVG